jgi:hypothetical protein
MARRITIASKQQLYDLEDQVAASAASTAAALAETLKSHDGLGFLRRAKFMKSGCDPLASDRPLNLIEQINQSFTYLVSIRAAEYLLERYPENAPFTLNLGAIAGPDIISADGSIAAETFAATSPESNKKVRKDIEKVTATGAAKKYVFFYAEECRRDYSTKDVNVIRVKLERSIGFAADPG